MAHFQVTRVRFVNRIFRKLIREPLVQFLIVGAGIYGLYALWGVPPQEEQDRTVVITEDHVSSLATGFAKRWNRPPTNEELLGLVREYVRETLLYREALTMGLDKDDHIIRRRMAQKLEFLTNDLVKLSPPDDAVLQQYLDDNMARFRAPDLITFSHIFIDPDQRGDETLPEAELLLGELRLAGAPDANTLDLGDRFMMQSHFAEVPYREIQRQMGSGFADAVMLLEPGQWHGPVLSGYGVHLVYVSGTIKAGDPALDDVREDVMNEYFRDQTEKFNAEYLEALMERYEVIMEDPVKTDPEDGVS
jgi:hypothetical protein